MNDLFINVEEREKLASAIPLGNDMTVWVKKIIMSFSEEHPTLQKLPMNIQWKEKDMNSGAAVGSLKVGDRLDIPLIVENFGLFPLDIMMLNGRAYPLTPETLQEYIQDPSVFQAVANIPQQDNEKLFDSPLSLPTEQGNTNTIDKVSSFVFRKEYNNLVNEAAKPENYAGFISNGTLDILEKISSISPKDEVDFGKALLNNLDMDRQLVGEDSNGNSFIKQANAKVDYTYTINTNSVEDLTNKVRKPFSKTAEARNLTMSSYAIGEETLCINEDLDYHVFSKTAGVPVNPNSAQITSVWPEIGDTGVIVLNDYATKPFEVTGLRKVGNYYEIDAWNGMSSTTYYPLSGITRDSIEPHETEKNAYYVPGNAKYLKLNNVFDVSFEKASSFKKLVEPHTVHRDTVGLYSLTGTEFSKYAERHEVRNLNEFDVKWAATHCGAYNSDLEKISSLKNGESYQFTADLKAPISTESIQNQVQSEYDRMTRDLSIFPENLVKEAAGISDKNSVDALLSLGLVNRDNVMEFTTLVPEYEAAAAGIAKLLITARLGLKILDEDALTRGMKALTKAIYQLKYLKQIIN